MSPRAPLTAFLLTAMLALASTECSRWRSHSTDAAERGFELYDRMCSVCHGKDARGYAADHAPALANAQFLASVTDDQLRLAIAGGRSGTTMSAWGREHGGPLSPEEVDTLVVFLRSFSRSHTRLDESPLAGDADRGLATYTAECQKCHGDHGTGGPEEHIGNRDLLSAASTGFLRYAIRGGRPGTPMPGFAKKLGDPAIDDVVALLRSWQSAAPSIAQAGPARVPPLPLGPVPLNPKGPEPQGFQPAGAPTHADVIHAQLERGARMALLDARAPSDYVNEHIAGAVSVPFYDPAPYYAGLPKDAWLVCYCSCPHAESGQLAHKLLAQGFAKVTVLDEGLPFWRSRKYATHSGDKP